MELIQIIESTVFIFSLGLLILLIMSYLLFKVKNGSSPDLPAYNPGKSYEVSITYEKPETKKTVNSEPEIRYGKRFTVVNEMMRESVTGETSPGRLKSNSRYYIYKPGRNRIITNLQLSRIKK